jgi:hypothetical protein
MITPTAMQAHMAVKMRRDHQALLPFIPSLDFWVFDFATKTHRQLTRLSNQGAIGTFDITPDGKAIVFDRSRENSDIVLIEVVKK